MKKIAIMFLSLAMTVCLGGALTSCKDKESDSAGQEQVQGLLPQKMTLNVGDSYKFEAYDGKHYDGFSSEDAAIVAIDAHGGAVAKAEGTVKVILLVDGHQHICEITVLPNIAVTEEQNNIHNIQLENTYFVRLNESLSIEPLVYKNGDLVNETVTYTVPENDVLTHTTDGNCLNISGKKLGYVKVTAKYEDYEKPILVKVYDDSSYLAEPSNQRVENGKLVWDAVGGAVGYRVSFNLGQSWTDVGTALEYAVPANVHTLNMSVMALAPVESAKLNSKVFTKKTESVTTLPAGITNVTKDGDDFAVTVGAEAEFGKQAFYLYAKDSANTAVLANGENSYQSLSTLTYCMSVTSDVDNTIYFVTKSVDGKVAYSAFEVEAGKTTEVGYKLNGHDAYLAVTAEENFSYTDAVVTLSATDFEYSTVYYSMKNAAEGLLGGQLSPTEQTEQEKIIQTNLRYLKDSERNVLFTNYNALMEEVCMPSFIDAKMNTAAFKGNGTVSMNTTDFKYVADGDASSVKITFTNSSEKDPSDNVAQYDELLPATEPSYDYYVWRIYASVQAATLIGDKAVTLEAGWNTVELSYEELTGHSRIYVYLNPSSTVDLYLGSLTGGVTL